MIGYWVYKFHKNLDLTLIEYKLMVDLEESFYPETTICMNYPFIKNDSINVTNAPFFSALYELYLQGYGLNESYELYEKIDYHHVTPNLFDYFDTLIIFWKPGKNHSDSICLDFNNCPYFIFKNNYNGFTEINFQKCFGIKARDLYAKDIKSILLNFFFQYRPTFTLFHTKTISRL